MELKKGYKQTELGVIPEGWEVKNILDNFTLKARIGWQGLTTAEYLSIGDYGLVTGTDFRDGYINWENCVFVEKIRYVQDKNIQLQVNDVLVTKDGTIGKVAFINQLPNPTTLNSGIFVVRPKNRNIDERFFYYILMSFYFDIFLSKITAGSTITHLYQKDFSTFNFILPQLSEQTAIAQALSDADTYITSLVKLIEKKKTIKQGAMQELLRPGKGWVEVTINDLCIPGGIVRGPFGGALKKEVFVDSGYKVYEQRNAIYQNLDLGNYFITHTKFKELKRFEVQAGDFIISCSGTIGRIFQIPSEFPKGVINQALLKLTIDASKYSEQYFFHYFSWDKFQSVIIDSTQGGAMKNLIGMPEFKKTVIPMPASISEQEEIAEILIKMDEEITALECQLNKSILVKQGMIQELLTGKIRLI